MLPEEHEEFDRDYRRALASAADSLDLAEVLRILEHWRLRVIISSDPEAYRLGLAHAVTLLSGEQAPVGEPLTSVKERLDQLGA
ncbi:MAG: hypothetical protein H0X00_00040 [Sporichthya sp.]|nr:hypothetical protein [Sporichthya sp.]